MKQTRASSFFKLSTALLAVAAASSVIASAPAFSQSASILEATAEERPQSTSILDIYPLITTSALFEARDFYVRHFDFHVVFEASWAVYLASPSDGDFPGAILAFMHPDHPSYPPGPEAFDGLGMIVTIQVPDSEAFYERLLADGAPIIHPLTEEAWGQRRFMTRDPAGVLIDVVQQIQPEAGYWERYPAPTR